MPTDPDAAGDLATWAMDLALDDVPQRVLRSTGILRTATVGAAAWTRTHPVAETIAAATPAPASKDRLPVPGGEAADVGEAAAAAAALSVAQDNDTTLLGGHVSHSAALVPLAAGAAGGHDGAEVAAAQVAASEVAARLGAAAAVGELRGQMTTFVHAAAAAVARARLEDRPPGEAAAALRTALESPRIPTLAGFLGGDGKHRAVREAVREGWSALDAVDAGHQAPPGLVEGGDGFLEAVCDHPLPEFLGGLGRRWHLSAPTVKAHPACYYALAAVEAALELAEDVDPDDVATVTVEAPLLTTEMDAASAPHVQGPGTPLSALNFTVGWNVAAALADGEHTPRQLHPGRVDDPATWDLARRVDVEHDPDRTAAVLEADIPVGLPLRRVGPKVVPYAAKVLGPATAARHVRLLAPLLRSSPLPDDLSGARKAVGSGLEVELADGTTLEAAVEQPTGSAGRPLDELEDVARRKARTGLEAGPGTDPDLAEGLLGLHEAGPEGVAAAWRGLAGGD